MTFTPRDVFESRTVAALAKAAVVEDGPGDESGDLPLTPHAARLLETGVEVRAIALDVPESCAVEAVHTAVGKVLDQHPMLWVRLDREGDSPVLRIPLPTNAPARHSAASTRSTAKPRCPSTMWCRPPQRRSIPNRAATSTSC